MKGKMTKAKVEEAYCEKKFPTFAVILLAVAVIWLVSDLGYIIIDIPWLPIIIGIIAIGMIVNKHHRK